jgi:CheY-like chemotaxis protein
MRDYVRRLLGARYDVQVAEDGEAAHAAIEKHPPDLVLSDIMMPRLDGLGLLTRLRSNPRTSTLPIILLSARAGEEARVEGLQTGADDYLIKPFTARELLARVAANLATARIRRDAAKAAEASEARLAAVLRQIPLAVGATDQSGRMVIANAAMRRFASSVVPSRDAERMERWRAWAPDGSLLEPSEWPGARALRGETVVPGIEMLFVDDDGRETWNLVSTAPMRRCCRRGRRRHRRGAGYRRAQKGGGDATAPGGRAQSPRQKYARERAGDCASNAAADQE